jgi:16S rRNA processing protein RimM
MTVTHSPIPKQSECLKIGKIVGFHGLKGDAKVRPADPDPSWTESLTQVFIFDFKKSETKRLEICNAKPNGPHVLLRFKGFEDRTMAEPLMGYELYALAKELPQPEEDEYYAKDLIGLNVYEQNAIEPLGRVNDMLSSTGADFLEIRLAKTDKTIVVPFQSQFFPDVNLSEKRITLDLPPGFIDSHD